MLSIGDFARYAQVSVRMLRHYDALGLLVPAYVDPVTGYRSYTATQLARVNRLVALKDLGLTLDQVGRVLREELSAEELRGMLRLREVELAEQINADELRLAAVADRLRMIEKEGTMSELEYVEKSLPAVRLAGLSADVEKVEEIGPTIGPMFDRLVQSLTSAGLSLMEPAVAWYDGDENGMHIAAGFPTTVESVDGAEITDLPGVDRAVTVVHHGSVTTIGDIWQSLVRHVEEIGAELTGPCREVYLAAPIDDPDAWVTELQQPVR